jgi:hypothetical protein
VLLLCCSRDCLPLVDHLRLAFESRSRGCLQQSAVRFRLSPFSFAEPAPLPPHFFQNRQPTPSEHIANTDTKHVRF